MVQQFNETLKGWMILESGSSKSKVFLFEWNLAIAQSVYFFLENEDSQIFFEKSRQKWKNHSNVPIY